MCSQWKVDVHDRVRSSHPPIDHRPRTESIDDPRVIGRPRFQRASDLVKRRAPPPRQPLDLVDLMHRNAQMKPKGARKGGLPPAAVSDKSDAPHRTIVTRKRERGPPP